VDGHQNLWFDNFFRIAGRPPRAKANGKPWNEVESSEQR